MERNKVFISSVMGGDVDSERAAVIEVVDSNPYLRAWDFQREPASPGPLKHAYLQHVDDCALFVAIVSSEITQPVEDEFKRAEEARREILVFRKRVENPSDRVKSFLSRADVKYATFGSVQELKEATKAAVDQYIAGLLVQLARPTDASRSLLYRLRTFANEHARVYVRPAIPRQFDMDLLTVEKATADAAAVHKTSGETIWITTEQISSIRPSTPSDPGRLLLHGRLQWLSVRGRWAIFDESPTTEYGIPKPSGQSDPPIMEIQQHCVARGRRIRWVLSDHVPTLLASNWHVFYDGDGRYFSSGGQILMVDGLHL